MISDSHRSTYLTGIGYTSFVLAVLVWTLISDDYTALALVYAGLIFAGLFFISKPLLFFFVLFSRIILDSIPHITYTNVVSGLSFMELFTFGLMVFMLSYLYLNDGIQIDGIVKSMMLLLAVMCLTTIYHGNLADLIHVGSRWLYFMIAYLFFRHIQKDIPIKKMLALIAFASLFPLLDQLYSVITGAGSIHLGKYVRYAGSYAHVHIVADYLFFAVPAVLYLIMAEKRTGFRAACLGLLLIYPMGIYWAGYRTNWIALSVFLCLYTVFISRRKIATLLAITGVALIFWSLVGDVIVGQLRPLVWIFEDPAPLFCLENYQYHHLLSGRIGLWALSLQQYLQAGWLETLIGLGLGYTKYFLSRYMHNEYMSALVETGIVGLTALAWWTLTVIRTALQIRRSSHNYHLVVLSIFLSFLIISLGTMPFQHIVVINYMAVYTATLFHPEIRIVPAEQNDKKLPK